MAVYNTNSNKLSQSDNSYDTFNWSESDQNNLYNPENWSAVPDDLSTPFNQMVSFPVDVWNENPFKTDLSVTRFPPQSISELVTKAVRKKISLSAISDWFANFTVDKIKDLNEDQCVLCCSLMQNNQAIIRAQLSREEINAFYTSFKKYGLEEIDFFKTQSLQGISLKHQHRYYTTHQKEWRALTIDRRTQLVKEFCEADLPAISLLGARINKNHFDQSKIANTVEKLSWYREFVNISIIRSPEICFHIMKQCQQQGVQLPHLYLDGNLVKFVKKKSGYIEMLYQECKQNPIYRYFNKVAFDGLFQSKLPLPTLDGVISELDAPKIETMNPDLLPMWHFVFSQKNDLWNNLNESVRTAFVKRFVEYREPFNCLPTNSPCSLKWINNLSTDDIKNLSYTQSSWFCELLRSAPSTKEIEFRVFYAFDSIYYLGIPYELTSEVIAAAQNNEALLRNLIWQFKNARNRKDYGFKDLSDTDQATLRGLFKDQAPLYLPYRLTPKLINKVKYNTELFIYLLTQLGHEIKQTKKEKVRDDFGFRDLSAEDQAILRGLFYKYASTHLPYKLTSDEKSGVGYLTQAESLNKRLLTQLHRCFDPTQQKECPVLEVDKSTQCIKEFCESDFLTTISPRQLTSKLVNYAKNNRIVLAYLLTQFKNEIKQEKPGKFRNDFGFKFLPAEDQATLRRLFKDKAFLYLPYRLTPKLINNAEKNKPLLAYLITQFEYEIKQGKTQMDRDDFGFKDLPPEDQEVLRGLFEDKDTLCLPCRQTTTLSEREPSGFRTQFECEREKFLSLELRLYSIGMKHHNPVQNRPDEFKDRPEEYRKLLNYLKSS